MKFRVRPTALTILSLIAGSVTPASAWKADTTQLVIVEVTAPTSTSGTLSVVEVTDGKESIVMRPVPARVGRSGVSASHREGDGTTPLGRFAITGAFGLAEAPRVLLPYRRVREGDCWISGSGGPSYNFRVRRSNCGSPNEDLWRIAKAGPYEYALTTSYNTSPVVAGKGSAIFIHVNSSNDRGETRPTSGCVSVAISVMKRLFALLDPAKNPTLIVRIRRS